ncbi:MAG TPA: XRE family transcriptional regulator, partial [Anaerolineae bacterium]|nr:XRE family transcriptional regulator [Anaerolineae bacterium]
MLELDPFATWLKRRRKALDLTREALAKRAHCSASTIRRLEAGDLRASAQLAESLAAALNVPIDQRGDFVRFVRGDHSHSSLFTHQTDARSSAVDSPPPNRSTPPNNLPAPLTSLVGRQREINAICDLLNEPGVRLLTLTGPPGTGKTRLSIAVAQALIEANARFTDGVFFVPLAPIEDAQLVASALVQVLSVRESPSSAGLLEPLRH